MATPNNETKVITGKVRLSYAHLFEPWSGNPDQDPKYSTVLLIPKSDKETIRKIKAAEQAALEAGKDSRWGGRIPKGWKSIIHDGDEEADLETNPEYEGCIFMSVASKTRPGVVDSSLNEIIDSSEVYSGCYALVSINAFPYNVSGNKGVSFGLNHVMKKADGEFLGGRSRAEDDFAEYLDDDDDEVDDLV